jgi:hypothetical protein
MIVLGGTGVVLVAMLVAMHTFVRLSCSVTVNRRTGYWELYHSSAIGSCSCDVSLYLHIFDVSLIGFWLGLSGRRALPSTPIL